MLLLEPQQDATRWLFVSIRHVDLAFYMQGVPRLPSPLRDPSEDDDNGSSTEPSDDVYQAIERRLHDRAPGTVSHFIRGRYRSRFIGRTFSSRNASRIAAAHRTFLLAVLSEVAGIFVICLQHLIDLLESL